MVISCAHSPLNRAILYHDLPIDLLVIKPGGVPIVFPIVFQLVVIYPIIVHYFTISPIFAHDIPIYSNYGDKTTITTNTFPLYTRHGSP